ncbi:hypothetical protein BLA29_005764, partial [Euroglyphus maynei]
MQRFSLTNKTFIAGINQYPPFIRIDADGTTILGGIEVEILYTLRDYFNFSTTFINTHDDYGQLQPNGTWTGMFGNLSTNRMDLSISGMVITEKRFGENVTFLYPHWQEQYTFATLPPRLVKSHDINIFLRPFHMNVWLTLIIMFILLYLINIFVQCLLINKNEQSNNHRYQLPWSFGIRLLLNQTFRWKYMDQIAISMKFLLMTWSLAILILNNHYVSFLFSSLSLPPTMPTIDSIQKLNAECNRRNIEILVDDGSFIVDFLG